MKKQLFAVLSFLLLQMPLAAQAERFQAVGTADVLSQQLHTLPEKELIQ